MLGESNSFLFCPHFWSITVKEDLSFVKHENLQYLTNYPQKDYPYRLLHKIWHIWTMLYSSFFCTTLSHLLGRRGVGGSTHYVIKRTCFFSALQSVLVVGWGFISMDIAYRTTWYVTDTTAHVVHYSAWSMYLTVHHFTVYIMMFHIQIENIFYIKCRIMQIQGLDILIFTRK
jgi:hypothetical protein